MDKKNKKYTALSDVDHKMQFVNLIGVINEITPAIKRNKMLGSVLVEIIDTSLNSPGFSTTLHLESEVLDQFLAVARRGLIIEFLDIKVAKNDGEIRGEVWDEEEVRLYNDDSSRLNWWVEEKKVPTSDKAKRSIKELRNWKKNNFNENSETSKPETKTHKEKKSLQNESINLERSRSSNLSQKKSNISSEDSPKDSKKKKADSLKRTITSIDISGKSSPKDSAKANPVLGKSTQRMDGKRKEMDEKTEKYDSVHPDVSKKKKSSTSAESLRSKTDDIVGHDEDVSQLTHSKNSEKSNRKSIVQSNHMKSGNKTVEKKFDQEKTDKTTNKRTSIKRYESRSSDSSPSMERESKLLRCDSSASDMKSPLKNKANKEKLSGLLSRSKDSSSHSLSNLLSSSSSMNSINSNDSKSDVQDISGPAKKSTVGKSQKESIKQGEKSNNSKGIQNKPSAISKEKTEKITQSSTKITRSHSSTNISQLRSSKITRSSSSTCISQLKVLKSTTRSARNSSPIRNRVLNSSTTKLNKQLENNKSRKNDNENVKIGNVQVKAQQKCTTPINDDRNPILQDKKKSTNTGKTENESKLKDSSKIQNINESHRKTSGQDINNTSIVDKKSTPVGKKNSVIKKSLTPKPSDQEGSPQSLKRKSKTDSTEIATSSDKKDLVSNLASLTRKIHLLEVEYNGDVSTCEIEDVDVPEKMDLQCKVLSHFYLFGDNIQVIRVQDGTICNSPALCIPQKDSWEEVVATILQNPTVAKKPPCIDIIIFDFPLMENPIVPGEIYCLKNVMAIKLNLKDDPRKEKLQGELFFCAKGPSIYNKKRKIGQEIEKKLGEEKYKKLLAEFLGEQVEMPDQQQPPPKTPKLCHDDPLQAKNAETSPQKTSSPTNRKRKLAYVDNQTKDNDQASGVKSQKIDSEGKMHSKTEKETLRKKDVQNLPKINPPKLSDETTLGETDCLIIKELSEIMHEESLLGLPQTLSEDVHLKNTGSEVTFSQFCAGAEGKADNFRTSTQVESLSEDIVPLDHKEPSHTPDSSKMEPLVYSPSSCSLSDSTTPKKVFKSPQKTKDNKECSESILQNHAVRQISDKKTNIPKFKRSENKEKDVKETTNNLPTNNDSLSVEVLSSNSSVIEVDVIGEEDCSNKNKNTASKLYEVSVVPDDAVNLVETLFKPVTSTRNSRKKFENEFEKNRSDHNFKMELAGNSFDKEEDANSLKSTIVSNFSFKNNIQSVTCEKSFYVSPNKSTQSKVTDSNIEMEESDSMYPSSFDQCKRIPDSCFFQSARNQYPSTEEINAIFNEENHSLKYFSYSLDRNLPFLTFDVIRKLDSRNYVTVTAAIEKISPPITDSWKNECIKARCSCCNKLYSAYNALNNTCSENSTSPNALYVRGMIVCPESQCCNQVLETPEFHFSVDTKLKDGTPVTALISGTHAEELFGCKAQDAARDETALSRIERILQKISAKIDDRQFIKIDFKRENICNPKSGPLYIKNIHF